MESHPIVVWELTRACDLNCRNCTFPATISTARNELTTFESYKTIDQIAALGPKEFIMTGGDPLERFDIFELVDYARRRGLDPALVISPTTRLSFDSIERLQSHGLNRLIFSIDGSLPALHDGVHGTPGAFGATTRAMRWARTLDLKVEVNTLITRRNMHDLPAIIELIKPFAVERWSVYFIVPTGRGVMLGLITADEVESVFGSIYDIAQRAPFAVRTIEAPHYRRYVLQRELESWADFSGFDDGNEKHRDIRDCAVTGPNGYVFVSHAGDVRASEFLALSAGNVRYRPLSTIYREAALFDVLRDPKNLKGKCAPCEFRMLCGGSRARAWAMGGDLFGADPLCAYQPGAAASGPVMSHIEGHV
jgi:radical SAM protein with 4Fe4S-binding SPASM domain